MKLSIFRSAACGSLLACVLGIASRVFASAIGLTLEPGTPAWLGTCLSEERLHTSYLAAASSEPRAQLSVSIRALEQAGARIATLEIRAQASGRDLGARVLTVHARDCAAVPDAVALVVVLLSRDVEAAPPEAEPTPEPAPAATPPSAPIARAPLDPELLALNAPEPPERTAMRWRGGLGAALVWGLLPRTAVGLSFEGEIAFDSLAIRLRAELAWPQTLGVAEGTVRMFGASLAADACTAMLRPGLSFLGLRACAGPRAGVISASSRGFALRNLDPVEPTIHLGALLEVAFMFSDTSWLRLGGGASVALVRPIFLVEFQANIPRLTIPAPDRLRSEAGLSLVQIF